MTYTVHSRSLRQQALSPPAVAEQRCDSVDCPPTALAEVPFQGLAPGADMAHVASASGAGSASAAGEGAAASGASRPESSAPVVDRSSVEGIKARYRGNALIERLSYLGEVAPASRSSAMALAAAESKAVGSNTGLYASLCEAAGTDPDAEWVSATKARVHTRQEALERELNMKLAAQDRDAIFVSRQVRHGSAICCPPCSRCGSGRCGRAGPHLICDCAIDLLVFGVWGGCCCCSCCSAAGGAHGCRQAFRRHRQPQELHRLVHARPRVLHA